MALDPDPASSFGFSSLFALLIQSPSVLQAPPGLPEAAASPLGWVLLLAGLLALLVFIAFLAGTEAALRVLSKTSRSVRLEDLTLGARALLKHPRASLVSVMLYATTARLAAGAVALGVLLNLAAAVALPPWLVIGVGFALFVAAAVALAEIAPRVYTTARAGAFIDRAARVVGPLHRRLGTLPSRLEHRIAASQRVFKSQAAVPEGGPDAAPGPAPEGGALDGDEDELFHSIAQFSETTAREVMVSRMDVVALPVAATRSEAVLAIKESGYSRLPLYVQHLDNVLGIVYVKDLLAYLLGNGYDESEEIDWRALARPAMFVSLDRRLDALLRDFQTRKTHIAIVVDEYGGTAGLVTMEDILEEIVGDIRDEHDEEEEEDYHQIDPHTYSVDARMHLDDLSELLDLEVATDDFDFETLGGLLMHLTGAVPAEGTTVAYESLSMTVERVDNHRIARVRIQVEATPQEAVSEEQTERND